MSFDTLGTGCCTLKPCGLGTGRGTFNSSNQQNLSIAFPFYWCLATVGRAPGWSPLLCCKEDAMFQVVSCRGPHPHLPADTLGRRDLSTCTTYAITLL